MWIAPRARGLGLGRRLLETLETCALAGGATGWVDVPRFNDEPLADHWLEKALIRGVI